MSIDRRDGAVLDEGAVERYVIDPSGTTWDVDRLAACHGASEAPIIASVQTMIEALVIDKGYAGLRISAVGCQVFLNATMIFPATLAALLSAVAAQRSQLIITGCHRDHWCFKILGSKAEGLDHIQALAAQHREPTTIRSRTLSRAALARSSTPELASAMELIGASRGKLDGELLAKISELTARRFLVCSWQPGRHVWRVEQAGTGYGKSHLNLGHHQTLGNQPAYQYGCWAHDHYLAVKEGAAAVVEEVDALMFSPDTGRLRARHRRILAPMIDEAGRTVLFSTSVRDATIDLGSGDAGATPGT